MTKSRGPVSLHALLALVAAVGCSRGPLDSSLAVGSDGLGLIAYGFSDTPTSALKAAHCMNAACSEASVSVLDSDAQLLGNTSVAFGVDGLALIAYVGSRHVTTGGTILKIAHCADIPCTHATLSVVDDRYAHDPIFISLAVGGDGLGLMSYRDHGGGHLLVAHCSDIPCTTATVSILDPMAGSIGEYSSLAIGHDGRGLIAYHDRDRGLLKLAHCENATCTSATLSVIEGEYGRYADIAVGTDGLGLIGYADGVIGGDLKVAHCADVACTHADAVTTLDRQGPTGRVGQYASVTIGPDGLGLISYRGMLTNFLEGDLRVAHCQDVACRSAVVTSLDRSSTDTRYTSVAIGGDGLGLISFVTSAGPAETALETAHCQDVACTTATVTAVDAPPGP
jgi:hypothetical protein